ncbi:hypothetical protein GQ600_982 [Phytophthora cactorum]|nr:hypothetical protein GQ600_982 [Phytophthora cactorum]
MESHLSEMERTVMSVGRSNLVRWLCEHTVEEEEKYDETCDEVMKHVLKFGDDDLTKFLLRLADAC